MSPTSPARRYATVQSHHSWWPRVDNALLVHAAIAYGYASLDVAHPASQLAVNQLQTHLPYHARPFLPGVVDLMNRPN